MGGKKNPDITWKRPKEGNGEGVEYIYRPKIVLWKQALMASPAFISSLFSENEYKTANQTKYICDIYSEI